MLWILDKRCQKTWHLPVGRTHWYDPNMGYMQTGKAKLRLKEKIDLTRWWRTFKWCCKCGFCLWWKDDFLNFCNYSISNNGSIFEGWHNKEYLRVCMANLYEKHIFGIGKSRITDEKWARLCEGYEQITGEKYVI